MLLTVRNLSKSHGAIHVLSDVSFVVNDGDRIGLVGSNGVGKSTLLKILVGHETIDSGSFSFASSIEVGYLSQTTPDFYGRTMQDLILESLGNLRQLEERMHELEAAMTNADVLLLDEPTNYISLDVLEAFETAILNFPGPVMAVSHDRWFIERFGGKVWELADGRLVSEVAG